jgi:hypothetical protein
VSPPSPTPLTLSRVCSALLSLSANGLGTLSFTELADLFSTFSKICEPEDKARTCFCMYDIDRDCKLDKTDIGNVVLRLVFDMPPLLCTSWDKVEPRMNVFDYKDDEMALFNIMIVTSQAI